MPHDSNPILVSVRLMTYNQAPFIAEAIESCLIQETDFDFEIIIGDDFSTDGTKEICEEYALKYPKRIKFLARKEGDEYWQRRQRLGRLYNFVNIIRNCKGKYIALLDGDDYWNDEHKLQKQVDFLENNEDYAICFHPVSIIKDGELIEDFVTRDVIETTDINELARGNFMHTCSCVFRNSLIKNIPDSFYRVPAADYFLHMLNAKHGKIKKLSEKMAMYRMHNDSIHATKSQNQRDIEWIQQLVNMYPHFDVPVKDVLLKSLSDRIDEIIINDGYTEDIKIKHIGLKAELFPKDIHNLIIENKELKIKLNSKREAFRFLVNSIKKKVLL